MLELAGCSPDETACFGDDNDDIEPIKMCGMGIAVSNAISDVKAVADYIAGSNDEDGVAKFIARMLL
jgi:hydroxymethylpyrimidine pyrophosphatase-like HAD family hydrolase